jgi:hypothetical protein
MADNPSKPVKIIPQAKLARIKGILKNPQMICRRLYVLSQTGKTIFLISHLNVGRMTFLYPW